MTTKSVSAGRVGAAAGRDAADDGDLRDALEQLDAGAEDPAVAGERGVALLQPRAAGLDEADHRGAGVAGQAQHADDRVGVRGAQRAAEEAGVLRVAEHRPAADLPAPATTPSPGVARSPSAGERDRRADGREAARVAEPLEPLDRERTRLRASARRGAVASGAHAARQRTALWPPKPNEFEIATSGSGPAPFARALERARPRRGRSRGRARGRAPPSRRSAARRRGAAPRPWRWPRPRRRRRAGARSPTWSRRRGSRARARRAPASAPRSRLRSLSGVEVPCALT